MKPAVVCGAAALTSDPASGLAGAASARNAPLLILGSSGRGPLRAAVLGSVGAAAIKQAPCPVLLVPPARTGGPP